MGTYLKELSTKSDYELQVILSRSYAWEFCILVNPEFFISRQEILQPIADTYQYLIQYDRDFKNIPADLENRIRKSKYVEKFDPEPENVAASLPPRSGKSYVMNLCNVWSLGKYPKESIMKVSHSQRLFNKSSRHVRSMIYDSKFIDVFPGIELSKDNTEVAMWSLNTSIQGAFFGSGVGGQIVGFGASLIAITDDLYKSHIEANSKATNETTLEFMESAFDSRMETKCIQFDLGTRWSKKDYIGNKLKNDEYDIIIKIPALDENNNSFCEHVNSTKKYINKKDRLKRNGREHIFDAEYMQEPSEAKGTLFPNIELRRFKMADLNMETLIGKVSFIDTADKGKDFYSAPLGYIFPNESGYDVFITKVIFSRKEFKFTQPRQVAMILSEQINFTIVETNKEGSLYVNNLQKACKPYKVIGKLSKGDKDTRILMEAGYVLDFYFLVDEEQDDEYKLFFENLTDYKKEGDNENDDAPDSCSGLSMSVRSVFKHLKKYNDNEKENE